MKRSDHVYKDSEAALAAISKEFAKAKGAGKGMTDLSANERKTAVAEAACVDLTIRKAMVTTLERMAAN